MEIIAFMMVAYFAMLVFRTYWRQISIQRYGMETDAVISWIEEEYRGALYASGYAGGRYHYYYASFIREDGRETELRLINPKKRLIPGSRIRIKYLPGREYFAVLTEIMDN